MVSTMLPPPPSSRTALVLAFSARQPAPPIPVFEGRSLDADSERATLPPVSEAA